jgi:MipA family protein
MKRELALVLVLAATPAAAADLPLWEAGAGVAVLALPDYRGSDEGRGYVLPLPYFVYRGEFFKADRHGIRGRLFDTERAELDVSFFASLPVNSSDNVARAGMPDLEPSVEAGPLLKLRLWGGTRGARLELRAPLRAAFTVESSPRSIGWVATPHLNLDLPGRGALAGWNFGLLAGPVYGDRRQHEYYYGVAPGFATGARPAYEARGGYGGFQFLASASRRFARTWVGAFVRADTLRGAVFEASPLVKRDSYFAAGVGISWVIDVSSRRVQAEE